MLSFSVSYSDLINVLYFADTVTTTDRGDRGLKAERIGGGKREGEDRVTLRITLLHKSSLFLIRVFFVCC
jgi:hypothetical protein